MRDETHISGPQKDKIKPVLHQLLVKSQQLRCVGIETLVIVDRRRDKELDRIIPSLRACFEVYSLTDSIAGVVVFQGFFLRPDREDA